MLHFLSERISYRSSFLFVLAGLFFIIYPIIGIIKNDLLFKFLLTKDIHLHGANAIACGVGLLLIGISYLLRGIKSILEKRQRQNLYTRTEYSRLAKVLTLSRDLGIVVILVFCLVNLVIGCILWIA